MKFLVVYELNACYNFIPDFYRVNEELYTLPLAQAAQLRQKTNKTPAEQINIWMHDFLTRRNYKALAHELQGAREFYKDPMANTLKLKIHYILEEYSEILRATERLAKMPACWDKIDFRVFCLIQTGMAHYKLHAYAAAVEHYIQAARQGDFMGLAAIINWNKACAYEKLNNWAAAARCLRKILTLKTANFCGPRLIYLPEYYARRTQEN